MQNNLNANHNLAITLSPKIAYVDTKTGSQSTTNIVVTVTNRGEAISIKGIRIFIPPELIYKNSFGNIKVENKQASLCGFGKSKNPFSFEVTPKTGSLISIPRDTVWRFGLNEVMLTNTLEVPVVEIVVTVKFTDDTTYEVRHAIDLKLITASIVYFSLSSSEIEPGQTSTLSWECNEVNYCEITPGGAREIAKSTKQVRPNETTTYTLYAHGAGFTLFKQVILEVKNPNILAFSNKTDMPMVPYNSDVTMAWKCNKYTDYVILTNNDGLAPESKTFTGDAAKNGELDFVKITKPVTFYLSAGSRTLTSNNVKASIQGVYSIGVLDVSIDLTSDKPIDDIWNGDMVRLSWDIVSALEITFTASSYQGYGPSLNSTKGAIGLALLDYNMAFTVTAKGFKKGVLTTVTKTIEFKPKQVNINSFTIAANPIPGGDPILSWDVTGPSVYIQEIGYVAATGTATAVKPRYTLPGQTVPITLHAGSTGDPGKFSRTVYWKY